MCLGVFLYSINDVFYDAIEFAKVYPKHFLCSSYFSLIFYIIFNYVEPGYKSSNLSCQKDYFLAPYKAE